MASSPGSRTAGFIASPPAVSRPCGPPFASVVSTFPAPSGKPKPHETSALMSIPGKELHNYLPLRHRTGLGHQFAVGIQHVAGAGPAVDERPGICRVLQDPGDPIERGRPPHRLTEPVAPRHAEVPA